METSAFSWSSHFSVNGKVAYYHGRFQPFHLGHLSVVTRGYEECGAIAIGISNPSRGSPQSLSELDDEAASALKRARQPERNPWPYWVRALMIQAGLKAANIPLERVIMLPNVRNTGLPPAEFHFPRELAIVYISPREAHNRFAMKRYRSEGWAIRACEPTCQISGTEIRTRIHDGRSWLEMVPTGTRDVLIWYSNWTELNDRLG